MGIDKEVARAGHLRRTYGLTIEQYDSLLPSVRNMKVSSMLDLLSITITSVVKSVGFYAGIAITALLVDIVILLCLGVSLITLKLVLGGLFR